MQTPRLDFIINIKPETFIRYKSGSIIGVIWLTIGDWDFPQVGWDDFVVVILGWWLQEILQVLIGCRERVLCRFMDGSYLFDILPLDDETVSVKFYKDWDSQAAGQYLREVMCKTQSVASAILSAARTAIEICVSNGWLGRDLDTLMARCSQLESYVKERKG